MHFADHPIRRQTIARRFWPTPLTIAIISSIGLWLFILNRNTPVPASWGHSGGARNSAEDLLGFAGTALWPVIAAVCGVLIVRRYPRHRIGRLLISISLTGSVANLMQEWAVYGYFTATDQLPATQFAGWLTNWMWVVLFAQVLLMLALFPNGRMLSIGWRRVSALLLAVFAGSLLLAGMLELRMSSVFQIPNPFVQVERTALYNSLFLVGVWTMPAVTLHVLLKTAVRYQRSTPSQQRQIKWLLAGVVGFALVVFTGLWLSLALGLPVGALLVNNSLLLPIVGIGIAILRHQLYDIDIIIRRTLLYSLLSALLALLYFCSVILLQRIFGNSVGAQSPPVIVASTLLIAALFNPLRHRLQAVIDRRFYRTKYDARQLLAQFAQVARDETELTALSTALVDIIDEALQPTQISIMLRSDQTTPDSASPSSKVRWTQVAERHRP